MRHSKAAIKDLQYRSTCMSKNVIHFLKWGRRKAWVTGYALLLASSLFLAKGREALAMGVFDRVVLFSEVHGRVLKDGEPVAGAEVMQKVVWSDNENDIARQRSITDQMGTFSFPAIERKAGLLRLIPAQPTMLQEIVIRYGGAEYIAWQHGKNSYNANTELDGRPVRLICELTRQPDYEGKHYGICKAE